MALSENGKRSTFDTGPTDSQGAITEESQKNTGNDGRVVNDELKDSGDKKKTADKK